MFTNLFDKTFKSNYIDCVLRFIKFVNIFTQLWK